jgi:hypothetical protein
VAGTNVTVSGATGAVTINAPGFATPGSSAIGDTAAAGTATTVSRSDHVHGREAAGTPGASAVGDTASAGSATTVARSDHRHSREAFGTPVDLDASVTSLSAGSLTTVARADHIHTLSKVPVLIATTTFASNTANYTFSSIPQTFRDIRVKIVGRSTYASDTYDFILLQFNGDTAANYWHTNSTGKIHVIGSLLTAAGSGTSTMPGACTVVVPNYSKTTFNKLVFSADAYWNNSTSSVTPGLTYHYTAGFWNSSAAITSVKIYPNVGSFATNTVIDMYGIP